VDSVTLLKDTDFAPGSFVDVRCTGRRDYDLLAVPTSIRLPMAAQPHGVARS
jgi:hypothetical protein